jgi:hypothetical protein
VTGLKRFAYSETPLSTDFLATFGFIADPFASTNAADEPLISSYFVDPPFFPAVVGDPNNPKSNVVYAPRGGGKTAQKIMIEKRSAEAKSFLCISYDRFPDIKSPRNADSEFHLNNITRILLLAILVEIETNPSCSEGLSDLDKKLLVTLSRSFLGSLSAEKFKDSLSAIKSYGDKAHDLWTKYGGAVIALANAISHKFGIGKLELNASAYKPEDETLRFRFDALVHVANKIGYSSVYILVDRVDELSITAQDAEKGFEFLSSLLIDLPLLETPGVGFKFFLWDQMKEHYQSAGGRPDRLIEYSLDWSVDDLETVLQKRLEAYSEKRVSRLDELISKDSPYNVHKLVAYFANGSPRDMVRICKRIVDDHTKTGRFGGIIDFRTVKSAIASFSLERARELYGAHFTDLKKIGELTFTINGLASDVFRVTQQAARAKVQKWQASGAVVKIGDIPNPGNRAQYVYGILDPRLAVAVLSDASLEEAMDEFLIICPHCHNLRIAYEGEITCPDCQGSFKKTDAETLGNVCRKPLIAEAV